MASFEEGKVLGNVAERIVRNLFEEAGFEVIRYGYEHTVPELANGKSLIRGDAAEFIRHQPDFIVVNKQNEAFFIEVKFRKEGAILKHHMFPYPCCYVVLVTKDFIMAQMLP